MMPNTIQAGSPQALLDSIKSLVIPMAMMKGDSTSSSLFNTVILILLVSLLDTIALYLNKLLKYASYKFEKMLVNETFINNNLLTAIIPDDKKIKSIMSVVIEQSKNPTAEALIDLLTHLPHIKSIALQNGTYLINYSNEIEINKNVFACLGSRTFQKSSSSEMTATATTTTTTATGTATGTGTATTELKPVEAELKTINIYSYNLDMSQLRNEIDTIVKNYLIKMSNKLGDNIYYFSEIESINSNNNNDKKTTQHWLSNLHFTMKPFVTNRAFKNLFGKDIDIIKKRVEFFHNNKLWYDEKGIPYTLGVLMSGEPGCGKTSIIKCIANELKRHIINIHLSDKMTKQQLEDLFYNEQICVTQNGRTEIYTIPINNRIYVLEDVDCQCNIVLERAGKKTFEQELLKKNDALKKEVERLKFALSELSTGKKMVMMQSDIGNNQQKKDDDNSNDKITLSFLLNLLDGVLETPGRITLMTTNFVNKLDKAFIRPGRIDVICQVGYADCALIINMIEHRYDTTLTNTQIAMIKTWPQCITPAEIGRILFQNFDNLDGALVELENYTVQFMQKQKDEINEINEIIDDAVDADAEFI